jgi:hypothetical protein
VRTAVRKQDKSCSRRAGNEYLKSLRLLHSAALALARAKSTKDFNAVARRLQAQDRLATHAVNSAEACWRKTLK